MVQRYAYGRQISCGQGNSQRKHRWSFHGNRLGTGTRATASGTRTLPLLPGWHQGTGTHVTPPSIPTLTCRQDTQPDFPLTAPPQNGDPGDPSGRVPWWSSLAFSGVQPCTCSQLPQDCVPAAATERHHPPHDPQARSHLHPGPGCPSVGSEPRCWKPGGRASSKARSLPGPLGPVMTRGLGWDATSRVSGGPGP